MDSRGQVRAASYPPNQGMPINGEIVECDCIKPRNDARVTPLSTAFGGMWKTAWETGTRLCRISSGATDHPEHPRWSAVILVAALVALALVTQAGVLLVQRAYPPKGRMVEVAGGSLHDRYRSARRGRPADRDAAWREFQSRSDAPAGRGTARQKGSGDPDRSSRATAGARASRLEDSTPAIQGADDRGGAGEARRRPARFSWRIPGPAPSARGSRWTIREPVAGLVMLAPVAYPWPGGVGPYKASSPRR